MQEKYCNELKCDKCGKVLFKDIQPFDGEIKGRCGFCGAENSWNLTTAEDNGNYEGDIIYTG